jgi:predicted MFS family arabinose efflux permease
MSRRLILLFAIACGVAVASLYYIQPLLNLIEREFSIGESAAGLLVTLTQVGYALGLAFVVPLGDLFERRRLVCTLALLLVLSLLLAAVSPVISVLMAACVAIGLSTVLAQVLIPFAADLASDVDRGRVVGTVMSGLATGILVSRTVSGLISDAGGWRVMYVAAAGLNLALAVVLYFGLPQSRAPKPAGGYPGLMRSVLRIAASEPLLRRRCMYAALVFACFSIFWTTMAFLLAGPPYDFSEGVIGLFGLLAVPGVFAAAGAGRLFDRGHGRVTTGVSIAIIAVAFGLCALGTESLIPLILGLLILDVGVQGTHVTNQSVIYRIAPEARSRVTTVYMVCFFGGGALGSTAAALVYAATGWVETCALGAGVALVGFVLWLSEPRFARLASENRPWRESAQ